MPGPSPFYKIGTKMGNIFHSRLRMQMSQLNSHLFQIQRHDTPECACGFETENIHHFILACPNYNLQREELYRDMLQIFGENFGQMSTTRLLRVLLHGDDLGGGDCRAVAQHFQNFLLRSHRFTY